MPCRGGLRGERGAQGLGVDAGDVQVDRSHRVARHPLDAVDVAAGVGDPAGHGGERRRLEGRADDGHVRPAHAARPVVAGATVDLDAHPEVGGSGLDGVAELLPVARDRDEHAEDEPAPQHDLLDVDHLDAGPGQGVEDRRGDAGPVLAGERDQQRLRPRAPIVGSSPVTVAPGDGAVLRWPGPWWGHGEHHRSSHTTRSTTSRSSVTDLARAREFYGQAFGWRFNDYGPDYAGIQAADGGGEVGGLGVGRATGPGGVVALLRLGRPRRQLAAVEGGRRERRRGALRLPRRQAVHLRRPRRQRARRLPALRLVLDRPPA